MDTLNLIPGEIRPRQPRGPVFGERWRSHTGQPADQQQWREGWRMMARSVLSFVLFSILKWSLNVLTVLSRCFNTRGLSYTDLCVLHRGEMALFTLFSATGDKKKKKKVPP